MKGYKNKILYSNKTEDNKYLPLKIILSQVINSTDRKVLFSPGWDLQRTFQGMEKKLSSPP